MLYIYLGIQIKDGEWDIGNESGDSSNNQIYLYIIETILFAIKLYNIEKFIDIPDDFSSLELNFDKKFLSELNPEELKLFSKMFEKLSFIHNMNIFPIQHYGINKSSIEWTDINHVSKKCDILGDGAIHVNFFSGTGINFGLKMANNAIDNLLNADTANYVPKNPLTEKKK